MELTKTKAKIIVIWKQEKSSHTLCTYKNRIMKVTECGLLNFKNTNLEDSSDSVCKWMNLEKKFFKAFHIKS